MTLEIKYIHGDWFKSLKANENIDETEVEEVKARYKDFTNKFRDALKKTDTKIQVDELNSYLSFAKQKEKSNPKAFNERTKYYSSILEELPVLITDTQVSELYNSLLDSPKMRMGGLECVIRITANPNATPFYEKKRIDYALAIEVEKWGAWVPLVGLEVKKYMDKTMFGTVLETYKSLQTFRPRTIYGFVVEDEARSKDVVLNSMIYEYEHILTGKSRSKDGKLNPILESNYTRFVNQLKSAVEASFQSLKIE